MKKFYLSILLLALSWNAKASLENECTETLELVTNQPEEGIKLPDNDYTAEILNNKVCLKKLSVCVSYLSGDPYFNSSLEIPDFPLLIEKGMATATQEHSGEEEVYGFGVSFTKHLLFTPKIKIIKQLTDFSTPLLFVFPQPVTPQKVKMVLTQDVQKNDTKTYLDVTVECQDAKKKDITCIFPRRQIDFLNNQNALLEKNKKSNKKDWQQFLYRLKEDFPFVQFPVLKTPQLKGQAPYVVFQAFVDVDGKEYGYRTPLPLYFHKATEEIEEEGRVEKKIYLSPPIRMVDHAVIKTHKITIVKNKGSFDDTLFWSDTITLEKTEAIERFKIRIIEKESKNNSTFIVAMRTFKEKETKGGWEKTVSTTRNQMNKEKELTF
jgi:hypothetical protein